MQKDVLEYKPLLRQEVEVIFHCINNLHGMPLEDATRSALLTHNIDRDRFNQSLKSSVDKLAKILVLEDNKL